jgi:hypothetical protein
MLLIIAAGTCWMIERSAAIIIRSKTQKEKWNLQLPGYDTAERWLSTSH